MLTCAGAPSSRDLRLGSRAAGAGVRGLARALRRRRRVPRPHRCAGARRGRARGRRESRLPAGQRRGLGEGPRVRELPPRGQPTDGGVRAAATGSPRRIRPAGSRAGSAIRRCSALHVDARNRLWVLDYGHQGVGTARLLGFDLATDALVHRHDFPRKIALLGSHLNDLAVAPDGRRVYIADASLLAPGPRHRRLRRHAPGFAAAPAGTRVGVARAVRAGRAGRAHGALRPLRGAPGRGLDRTRRAGRLAVLRAGHQPLAVPGAPPRPRRRLAHCAFRSKPTSSATPRRP